MQQLGPVKILNIGVSVCRHVCGGLPANRHILLSFILIKLCITNKVRSIKMAFTHTVSLRLYIYIYRPAIHSDFI